MSLYSDKKIHSNEWYELPINEDLIDRVEHITMKKKAVVMNDGYPMFEWLPGVRMDYDNKDHKE